LLVVDKEKRKKKKKRGEKRGVSAALRSGAFGEGQKKRGRTAEGEKKESIPVLFFPIYLPRAAEEERGGKRENFTIRSCPFSPLSSAPPNF